MDFRLIRNMTYPPSQSSIGNFPFEIWTDPYRRFVVVWPDLTALYRTCQHHFGRYTRIEYAENVHTRECLAIRVERRIGSPEVIETLSDVMVWQGVPEHIRSDNGPVDRPWVIGHSGEGIRPHAASAT